MHGRRSASGRTEPPGDSCPARQTGLLPASLTLPLPRRPSSGLVPPAQNPAHVITVQVSVPPQLQLQLHGRDHGRLSFPGAWNSRRCAPSAGDASCFPPPHSRIGEPRLQALVKPSVREQRTTFHAQYSLLCPLFLR